MTNEEFVKERMPTAKAESHKTSGPLGKTYWLIRERGMTMYFAEGDTKAKAWKDAKESLEKKD